MTLCPRCKHRQLLNDTQVCGTCISEILQRPRCDKCQASVYQLSKMRLGKFYVHETQVLCRTCFGRRLIPDDKICTSCLRFLPRWASWNKFHGVCRVCASGLERPKRSHPKTRRTGIVEARRQRRLAAIPKDRRCPCCGRLVFETVRWVVKPEGSCCRSCSLKGFVGVKPAPERQPKVLLHWDEAVLPDGFIKCFKCGLIHEKDFTCGNT